MVEINNDWICYVAVPSITKQNKRITIGTCMDSVYRSALQRGYKNPVVFSEYYSHLKEHLGLRDEKKDKNIEIKILSIPQYVLKEVLG